MNEPGQLGRALHEEHFWTLVVMTGLEDRVSGDAGKTPLNPHHLADRERLDELLAVLNDMIRHHAFEEGVLFPMLWSRGAADVTVLFTQDHAEIGPLTKKLRNLTRDLLASNGAPDPELWERFRLYVIELAAQVMVHLQKEELVLVRHLGSMLGEHLDRELAEQFLAGKAPEQPCHTGHAGAHGAVDRRMDSHA